MPWCRGAAGRAVCVVVAVVAWAASVRALSLTHNRDEFTVRFYVGGLNDDATGEFVVHVNPDWAPLAANRFRTLSQVSFWDDTRVFRVIPGYIAQFGLPGDPKVAKHWNAKRFADEELIKRVSNRRGTLAFAKAGANTRNTQVFINLADNTELDTMGFVVFGEVVEGMDVVDNLYGEYGDGAPRGSGPMQARIYQEGNEYLDDDFPMLSYITEAFIEGAGDGTGDGEHPMHIDEL